MSSGRIRKLLLMFSMIFLCCQALNFFQPANCDKCKRNGTIPEKEGYLREKLCHVSCYNEREEDDEEENDVDEESADDVVGYVSNIHNKEDFPFVKKRSAPTV